MTSLLNLQTARVKDKFKAWLRSRTDGALAMYALFKEMDSDGDDSLSWEEFQQVTKKLGYATTTADLRELFLQFDVNGDGSVNFEEFFRSMRGDMSPARRELITNTFNAIDADRDGVATLTDIGKLLNPKNHPSVKEGRSTVPAFLKEFFRTLAVVSDTGTLTLPQFIEYYACIAAFDDDASFEKSMAGLWNAPEQNNSNDRAAASAGPRKFTSLKEVATQDMKLKEREAVLDSSEEVKELRKKILARGATGLIGLQRLFRIMDDDNSKSLNVAEFRKGVRECGLDVSDERALDIFRAFDQDKDGLINFDEFIVKLRGPVSRKRLELVGMAFSNVDKDGSGVINPEELVSNFDTSRHPDVLAGRQTAEQVLRHFMDTFDVGGVVDGMVTRQEFENYYANISASIDNDDYFELMIRNAWHISGGEGAAANSANRRVLVTRADGSQYVEEIKDDLGLKANDKEGMMKRLKAQGVDVKSISLFDGGDDNVKTGSAQIPKRLSEKNSNLMQQFSSLSLDPTIKNKEPSAQGKSIFLKKASDHAESANSGIAHLISRLRQQLRLFGGQGFIAIQRKFRIMDDDGSKTLSLGEMKKGMREVKMDLSDTDIRALFDYFDTDHSGSISFEEFLQGVRDPLNEKRLRLVHAAFAKIDTDGSGAVDGQDIASRYDASSHPEVLAGRMTPQQVLSLFLDTFDVGGIVDGKVTRQEFVNYYANIGASIDNDDYFELMIRNAWHISGGEGAAANSANRRVLVTRADGSQYVEEIKDDLGLKANDKEGMMKRLKAQGVDVKSIALFGSNDDDNSKTTSLSKALSSTMSNSAPFGTDVPSPSKLSKVSASGSPSKRSLRPDINAGTQLLLKNIKEQLKGRGGTGFIAIQRKFRIMDDDGSKTLSLGEMKKGLKEMTIDISDTDLRILFDFFDTDHSGNIGFEEFLQGVRDPLNEKRLRLVHAAFAKIDTDGSGAVDADEIASKYDASSHPEVLAGRMTPQQVLSLFLDTFDVGGIVDGKVTRQEFVNYYTNIGASIDNDDYFELMIRNAWHISGGEGAAANSANRRVLVTRADGTQYVEEIKDDLGLKANDKEGMMKRLKAQGVDVKSIALFGSNDSTRPAKKAVPSGNRLESRGLLGGSEAVVIQPVNKVKMSLPAPPAGLQPMIAKLKKELASRGAHGFVGLQRKFRIMDDDGNKSLSLAEFKKGMKEMNMDLVDQDLRLLFKYFDTNSDDSVNFEEFLQGLRNPLSERRLRLVNLAFNTLDTDGSSIIEAAEIASKYDASNHPDVICGKSTKEVIYREFLDTFDVGGEIDGMVTRAEFENYYTNIGASIDNDDYFELMIRNAWHISGGVGAAANTANRRLLVTRSDGTQYVEEIKDDLGLSAKDKEGMIRRLKAQGSDVASISLFDGSKDSAVTGVKRHKFFDLQSKKAPEVLLKEKERITVNRVADAVAALRVELSKRGASGIVGLQRKFRIMDDDGDRKLSKAEFTKAMKECNVDLSGGSLDGGETEFNDMFNFFDENRDGSIDFEEFLRVARGPINQVRLTLINLAFAVMDKDGSGVVDGDDVISAYDASKHPDVISRRRTTKDVLEEFLRTFEVGGIVDGKVTRQEFVNYYSCVSSSIDSDEYFELMIRNAWHISGGVGAAANSANRRVLVTRADGSQYVEEIKHDLGLDAKDKVAVLARLKAQGADASDISLFDSSDNTSKQKTSGIKYDHYMRSTLFKDMKAVEKGSEKKHTPMNNNFLGSDIFNLDVTLNTSEVAPRSMADTTNKTLRSTVFSTAVPEDKPQPVAVRRKANLSLTSSIFQEQVLQNPNKPKALVPDHGVVLLLRKLKTSISRRGGAGFIAIQRIFKLMDDDGSKTLSLSEFKKGMREIVGDLTESEMRILFEYFDTDHSGSISFEMFLQGVRDPLNEKRLSLVHAAFAKLDTDGSGAVDAEEIASKYDASGHPDVLAGKQTAEQVLRQFLDTFDVGGEIDGMVTRAEFENYYTNIGASIDNDDYFELMIRNAWHISGGVGAAANSANRRVLVTRADGTQYVEEIKDDLGLKANDKEGMMKRLKAQGVDVKSIALFGSNDDDNAEAKPARRFEKYVNLSQVVFGDDSKPARPSKRIAARKSVDALSLSRNVDLNKVAEKIAKLRVELSKRGASGMIGIQRKFRIIDDDNDSKLSKAEFKKAMKECALDLTGAEFEDLFDFFDQNKDGTVSFDEFLYTVRGPMADCRKVLVKMAFDVFDTDGTGIIDAIDIAKNYDASRHPDVIKKIRTTKDVLEEFLDTFDVGGVVDGMVTRQEFENYYANISASIDNDDYFELMIRNAWHISGGVGAAANSANRRVLVTRADGSQYVEEIKHDLGLDAKDKVAVLARLKAQGADASDISLFDGGDNGVGSDRKMDPASSKPPVLPVKPLSSENYLRRDGRANSSTFRIG